MVCPSTLSVDGVRNIESSECSQVNTLDDYLSESILSL
jgi:hypothetical protein